MGLVVVMEENNPEHKDQRSEETPTHDFWESWAIELEPYLLYGAVLIFGYYTGCDVSWVVII